MSNVALQNERIRYIYMLIDEYSHTYSYIHLYMCSYILIVICTHTCREEARNPPKPRGKVVHQSWGFFHYFKADHFFLVVALLLICYVFRTNFRDGDENGLLNSVNGQFDINTVRRAVVSELAMRIHGDKKEDSKEYV